MMQMQRIEKGRLLASRGFLSVTFLSVLTAVSVGSVGLLGCAAEDVQSPPASGGTGLAPLDLDTAGMKVEIDAMLRITDTLDRHRRMVQLMDSIDDSNLQGAVDAYLENMGRIDPHEVRLFANKWAQIDPHAAVDGILDWPYPRSKNEAVEEAVLQWILSGGGDDARAYVDPLYEGAVPTRRSPTKFMRLAVLKALGAGKNWDELTAMMAATPEEADRELWLTETLIEINRAHDFAAVKEWVDSIDWDAPGDIKVSAMERGLYFAAGLGFERASSWYQEIESNPRAIEVLPMAVNLWGVREPTGAISWLLERSESGVRDALIREITTGWLSRAAEAEEAEAWIRANTANPVIQFTSVIPLATHLVEAGRFRGAADLVREHAPPTYRDQALVGALVRWGQLRSAEVDSYIAEHDIANEVVERYRKRLAQRAVRTERRRRAGPPEDQG